MDLALGLQLLREGGLGLPLFPGYFQFAFGMIQTPFQAPILGTYRCGLAADFLDLHLRAAMRLSRSVAIAKHDDTEHQEPIRVGDNQIRTLWRCRQGMEGGKVCNHVGWRA